MTGDEFGELEHRDRALSVEDGLQLVVGVDLGSDLGVPKVVLLDVVAKLLGQVSPGQRFGSNDDSQNFIGLDWLEKSGVRFAVRVHFYAFR